MNPLHQQVCLRHTQREAVARCPECRHFFCRECVTEHDERLLCADCLRRVTGATRARTRMFAPVLRVAALLVSFGLAWGAFYGLGQILIRIPVDVHNGTVWQTEFWQE